MISAKFLALLHSEAARATALACEWTDSRLGQPSATDWDRRFQSRRHETRPREKPGFIGVWDTATGKLLGTWGSSVENFTKIGHSWLALLAAWLGGLLSRRLGGQADRPPDRMA